MDAIALYDAGRTQELLPFPALIHAIDDVMADLETGSVSAPKRQAVPFPNGSTMLSMPSTSGEVGVHKLVNVVPSNRLRGLPTITGLVSVYDGRTGQPLILLDGPTVTRRRTAAVSMLALQLLLPAGPTSAVIIGTGAQAESHLCALMNLYTKVRVGVVGHSHDKSEAFVREHSTREQEVYAIEMIPSEADLVITATTSSVPVYDEPPTNERVVIGVGACRSDFAEIGSRTLKGSYVYVDDLEGAREEAGDLLLAGVDWVAVRSLASLRNERRPSGPVVLKIVGSAAWDLAAARCALAALGRNDGH